MDIFTQQVEQNVVGVSTPTTLVPEPEIIVRTPSPWENSPVVDGARWTVFSQPVGTNAFANVDERVLSPFQQQRMKCLVIFRHTNSLTPKSLQANSRWRRFGQSVVLLPSGR